MKLEVDVHIYVHGAQDESRPLLHLILEKVTRIMASNAEILAALTTANQTLTDVGTGIDSLGVEVTKVGTETDALVKQVTDLTAALANVQTTPEVDAAVAALTATATGLQSRVQAVGASLQAVDDKVPDAPITP